MRQITFIAMLVSALVGVLYPTWVKETSDNPVASRPIYDVASGFRDVEARLDSARGSVRLFVQADVTLPIMENAEISLYALRDNVVVFVSSASLSNSKRRWSAGQSWSLSAFAGTFVVPQTGKYTFRATAKGNSSQGLDALKLIVRPVSSLETLQELTLFDRSAGYMSAAITLDARDGPMRVFVEADAPYARIGKTEVAVRAMNETSAVFESTAQFSTLADVSETNKSSRLIAHPGIMQVEKLGTYRFYASPKGIDGIGFNHLELVLKPVVTPPDERVSNIAFGVAALLLVIFHFSQYLPGSVRTSPSERPRQSLPKRKWGRDGGDK